MRHLKYLVIALFLVGTFFYFTSNVSAASDQDVVYVNFFKGEGCPHCATEEIFLEKLKFENSNVWVRTYEVWYDKDNAKLMQSVAKQLDVNVNGVPFTVIGNKSIIGFLNEESTGEQIKNYVELCAATGCVDIINQFKDVESEILVENNPEQNINLPLFGNIDTTKYSLFGITTIIAFLDGFNPCAMWILLFLISLLLGNENKKRRWILGMAFIITSGLVYYLFLAAWLNIFLFIGALAVIRIIIGIVAIGSGVLNLKSWYDHKTGCIASDDEKKREWFTKIKAIISRKNLFWALGGIIILAVAVNLVELMCSAGLPAIYTQVLSLADLPIWQYYLYLLWYVIIFMIDDAIIFIIAMVTLQAVGISNKYALWNKLIGGIIILIIGLLLILKPEWLLFG